MAMKCLVAMYTLIHTVHPNDLYLGLYWLSGKTSYHQISWSLEAARSDHGNDDHVALTLDRNLEIPVKLHSDWKSLNPNLAAPKLQEILR